MKTLRYFLRMKRFICLLVICNLFSNIYSQNWLPFNHLNTCNYSISNSFSDVISIKTDSIKTNLSDSIFILNKVVDAITYDIYRSPYHEYSVLLKPQFLLSYIRKTGNYFIFKDTIEYVFKIDSKIGDSWTFDSIRNIKAKVDTIINDNIFGQQDSFKYIILSTKDTIILSKKFGIVSFNIPNTKIKYSLTGIENLNLGFKTPNFYDFFDYNIGDIFEYSESKGASFITGYYHNYENTSLFKYEIISKEKINNDFKYIIKKQLKKTSYSGAFGTSSPIFIHSIDTIVFKYNDYSFLGGYNNQGILKKIATSEYLQKLYFSKDTIFNVNVKKHNAWGPESMSASYGIGIGLIQKDSSVYDFNSYYTFYDKIKLVGCKKNDVVYGTINPDWYFTDIQQVNEIETIDIYPNPVENYLNINIDVNSDNFEIKIIDINARVLLSMKIIEKENRIDMGSLNAGVYILKVLSKNEVWSKTFIKL